MRILFAKVYYVPHAILICNLLSIVPQFFRYDRGPRWQPGAKAAFSDSPTLGPCTSYQTPCPVTSYLLIVGVNYPVLLTYQKYMKIVCLPSDGWCVRACPPCLSLGSLSCVCLPALLRPLSKIYFKAMGNTACPVLTN